jgi:signal peptidase II
MSKKTWVFLAVLGACLGIDQASKFWVVANLRVGLDEIPVIPGFLSVVHAQNHGAAFSSLEGQWGLFMVFTAIATVVVLDLVRRLRPDALFMAGVLGMILSGALGNGLDRFRQRYVTDFIRVYTDLERPKEWLIENFGTNTWPIFNVADSVLLVGVSMFLVHYLFLEESDEAGEPVRAAEEPAG